MILTEGKVYWTGTEQFQATQCEKCGKWGTVNRFWFSTKSRCLGKLEDGTKLTFKTKSGLPLFLYFIEPEKHPELDMNLEVWADDETGGSTCDNCLEKNSENNF